MLRTRTLLALSVFAIGLTGTTQLARAATCSRLTPAAVFRALDNGQAAFAFDDEGQEQNPLYLTLLVVAKDGSFQGVLSNTIIPLPKIGARQAWPVVGTMAPAAPGVVGITLSFEPERGVVTTYAGAIEVFPSCYVAMAGTYSTERVVQTITHHMLGPVPFSGKVVRVPPTTE